MRTLAMALMMTAVAGLGSVHAQEAETEILEPYGKPRATTALSSCAGLMGKYHCGPFGIVEWMQSGGELVFAQYFDGVPQKMQTANNAKFNAYCVDGGSSLIVSNEEVTDGVGNVMEVKITALESDGLTLYHTIKNIVFDAIVNEHPSEAVHCSRA